MQLARRAPRSAMASWAALRNAGRRERRHPGMQRAGVIEQRKREERAARLPEAETEIEQRCCLEGLQYSPVALLGGTMSEDQRSASRGSRPHEREDGGGDDEAVDQHRHAELGRPGSRTEQRGDVASTQAANGLVRTS